MCTPVDSDSNPVQDEAAPCQSYAVVQKERNIRLTNDSKVQI